MGDAAATGPLGLRRRAVHLMQVGIVAVLLAGLWSRNVSVIVNAVLALAVTFLPALLRRDYSISLEPGLTLWLTTAVLLHAVGMLGLYTTVPWWDHVTHTLSATVVAAVGYTTTRAVDEHSDAVHFPPRFTFVFIVLFTLAFGVLWEVMEFSIRLLADRYGFEPILIQYDLEDTIVDLIFDLVGAVLVALFGTRELADLVRAVTARFDGGERPN